MENVVFDNESERYNTPADHTAVVEMFFRDALDDMGAIGALALVLRVIYLVELGRTPLAQMLMGDGLSYDTWARDIAAGLRCQPLLDRAADLDPANPKTPADAPMPA